VKKILNHKDKIALSAAQWGTYSKDFKEIIVPFVPLRLKFLKVGAV